MRGPPGRTSPARPPRGRMYRCRPAGTSDSVPCRPSTRTRPSPPPAVPRRPPPGTRNSRPRGWRPPCGTCRSADHPLLASVLLACPLSPPVYRIRLSNARCTERVTDVYVDTVQKSARTNEQSRTSSCDCWLRCSSQLEPLEAGLEETKVLGLMDHLEAPHVLPFLMDGLY